MSIHSSAPAPSRRIVHALTLAATLLAAGSTARAQGLQWLRSPNSGVWFAETLGPMSWTGAEALAQKFGGHLATVRDANDNAWLDTTFFSALSLYRHHWIGLHQNTSSPNYSEPNGGWRWSSGEPLQFSNWAPGQPDDAGLGQNFGRTAGRDANASHEWFDDDESASASFGDGQDLYVEPGALWIFHTSQSFVSLSQIQFVPGTDVASYALPLSSKLVTGGVLEIDDLYISPGATMKVEGPNPLVIMARGRVVIGGALVCDGNSHPGVTSLDSTWLPSLGAPGQVGGGRGGTGSPLTNASSPSGDPGFGAFHIPNAGGWGGETGWSTAAATDVRRGGGGGGGVFGRNVAAPPGSTGAFQQARIGFDAEPGFSNLLASNSAITGAGPAHGGDVGRAPFFDGDPNNDFYGRGIDASGQTILGELVRPWAGAGGGGGGDAARVPSGSFPGPWNSGGDEKGAGGGGGGGSCHIMALGRIVFGAAGKISARGGTGGGGENDSFLDRVGGGSGGGSGGHVVLQSAVHIDLRAKAGVNLASPLDFDWAVDVRGGQGGAGRSDLGGATLGVNGVVETASLNDACPSGYPTSGPNACRGHTHGAGGDGGPGLVQFHTPLGIVGPFAATADILVGPFVSLNDLTAPPPMNIRDANDRRIALDIGPGLGLVELESDDCDANGVPDRFEVASDVSLDRDGDGLLDACDTTVTYCVGPPSAAGCALILRSEGVPSATAASGFDLVLTSVPTRRAGAIFFGLAPTALPVDTHSMCVAMPRQRLGTNSSGGSVGPCDGELRVDWNAWRAAHPNAIGSPYSAGQTLYAQSWIREPASAIKLALSSAHRFVLAP